MIRARGLLLGGACFATLAGFTIGASAASSLSAPPTTHSAHRGAAVANEPGAAPAVASHVGIAASRRAAVSTPPAFVGASDAPRGFARATVPQLPAQTVTGVSPDAGAAGPGGEHMVTITGSGFTGATDVFFGNTDVSSTSYPCLSSPAGCFSQVSDTEIDADTPVGPSGTVDVTVNSGTANAPQDDYAYFDPPTVTNVESPQQQGASGITVIGTNFSYPGVSPFASGVSEVDLVPTGAGSTVAITNVCASGGQANCFLASDDTDLTINLPNSMTAGQYDTRVLTPGGTSATSSNDLLTVLPPGPALTTLSPSTGSTAGGIPVTLTGTNFTGATDVNWGAVDISTICGTGTCFSVDSDTQITVNNIPGHAAGGVPVTVTTGTGTSNSKTYTYTTPGPALTTLSPSTGSTAGGIPVTLTGTNFTGATDVNWGAVDISTICGTGTCFSVDSDTQITVNNIPGHAAGDITVTVTTGTGTSNSKTYTYTTPGPALTTLSPSTGSTAGGIPVTLTGTNFTGATDVNWGAVDISTICGTGTCFSVDSDTQITVNNIPSHAAGDITVTVTTSQGTSGGKPYTYVTPPPTLTTLSPTSGPTAGANPVTLTGTNFNGATDVNVGSSDLNPCGSGACFTIDSSTQITVTMPANPPGSVNVTVTTPGGKTASLQYTYIAPLPTVTNVSPNAGGPLGGNTVSLTGTGFEAAGTPIVSAVTVGTTAITTKPCSGSPTSPCFTVNSATSITIQVMPGGSGQVHITVATPGGISMPSSADIYTYVTTFPTVSNVSPRFGATSGGAFVIITGTNFGDLSQGFGATDILFGSIDVPSSRTFPCTGSAGCFEQIGTTTLDVYTPTDNNAGIVDITVQTPGGNSQPVRADDGYTYVAPGAFTAISPVRICDTRPVGTGIAPNECNGPGKGTLGPNGTITAQITGSTQVPAGAQAVVANITAIDRGTSGTVVIAYPANTARPVASNINLATGTAEANLAIVQLSSTGAITLFNSVGEADVIVDVEGFFGTPGGSSAGAFHSIPPLRMCDSRGAPSHTVCSTATGGTSAPLLGGTWRKIVLSGVPPGVPPNTPDIPTDGTAAAAAFNLTGTAASVPTYLAVAVPSGSDACPTKAPQFSNVNPTPGISLPNRVISNLGPHGDICLFSAAGSINFVIDVNGWFGKATASPGAFFYSVPPTRVCDTRPSDGTRCQAQPLGANKSELVDMAGVVAVPAWTTHVASPPVAVVANLTAVAGSAATVFTLYPSDESRPQASDLNPTAGEVIANLTITSLGQTGSSPGNVYLFNAVGAINAVLDVAGWFQ